MTKIFEPSQLAEFAKTAPKPKMEKQKSNKNLKPIKNINADYFRKKTISNKGLNKKNCLKHYEYYPVDLNEDPNSKLNIKILTRIFDDYEDAKFSKNAPNNHIKSYALNSYQGMFKDYNEDKICIIDPIERPESSCIFPWPKMSYFAVFDGHAGESCSQFLKENLHNFIIEMPEFPNDIKNAIIKGFEKAEKIFIKEYAEKNLDKINNSGSCALVLIATENKLYIGNCGDCRALLSLELGEKIKPLTVDHKPNNPSEYERIIKAGASVFLEDNTLDKNEV